MKHTYVVRQTDLLPCIAVFDGHSIVYVVSSPGLLLGLLNELIVDSVPIANHSLVP